MLRGLSVPFANQCLNQAKESAQGYWDSVGCSYYQIPRGRHPGQREAADCYGSSRTREMDDSSMSPVATEGAVWYNGLGPTQALGQHRKGGLI